MKRSTKGEQYNYYNTYLLKPLRGIFQLQVGCHVRPKTIEYKQITVNKMELVLGLQGDGWRSYDLLATVKY